MAVLLPLVVVLALLVVPLIRFNPERSTGADVSPSASAHQTQDSGPSECWVASSESGSPVAPGSIASVPFVLDEQRWRWYQDPTGYRVPVPKEWKTYASGSRRMCFVDPHGGRYLGIRAWQQSNVDIAAHLRQAENRAASTLPGFRSGGVVAKSEAFPVAEWEFNFSSGTDRIRASIRAQVNAGRTYEIYWCTWENTWQNNLQDRSIVIGGFRPAQ
jgi:hypothetical protein